MATMTRLATVTSSTAQHIIRLSEALEQLGVTLPKNIQTANQEASKRLKQIANYRTSCDPTSLIREVENKIANGTAELSDIYAAANAQAVVTSGPTSTFNNLFENAQRQVSHDLQQAHAKHGDKWIAETLRPKIDELTEQILKHTPKLFVADPRRDPQALDTMLYIPEVVSAWGTLHSIYQAFHDLRAYKIIPSTFQRNDCYQFTGNPGARDGMRDNDITWFVWAAQNNHKPGIYTEAENSHYWKAN